MIAHFDKNITKKIRETSDALGISADDLLHSAIELYINLSVHCMDSGRKSRLFVETPTKVAKEIRLPRELLTARRDIRANVFRISRGKEEEKNTF